MSNMAMDSKTELELLAVWEHSPERQLLFEERLTAARAKFTTASPKAKVVLMGEIRSLIAEIEKIKNFNKNRKVAG